MDRDPWHSLAGKMACDVSATVEYLMSYAYRVLLLTSNFYSSVLCVSDKTLVHPILCSY